MNKIFIAQNQVSFTEMQNLGRFPVEEVEDKRNSNRILFPDSANF